ncbi:translocation and assembly module TamA [Methylomarinovum tepidoasis]|uniref:Translocation and assembly module subunit TamA n=1 Tax=Methylomarinovum tepidoasis TaxID=2840183 RepID=A0AAU9CPF8_9GAMM|nr:autotransporter assembly complex family protein [Methylomarinovum sp. IN45]BCX88173.1 translocation and assembly module TamA [Methylomarinovum sp. IN45]
MRWWILVLAVWSGLANAAARPRLHIAIEGEAVPELQANIRAHLSVAQLPCSTPLARLQSLRRRTEREVNAAARALGYYHARITMLRFFRNEGCWQLKLGIIPGPRTRFGPIHIELIGEAANDPAFDQLRRFPPIHPGQPLDHADYEKLKLAFRMLALKRGYFDARFIVHELKVDPAKNLATVHLCFDSGPRYHIGPIKIEQDFLAPNFIRRYLTIKPEQPYESQAIAELHKTLRQLDLFEEIKIYTEPVSEPTPQVPINIVLTPRKRHRYNFGIGYNTNTGPWVKFGYENRRLNRYGHRFGAHLKLSFIDPSAALSYFIPLGNTPNENLRLNAGYRNERLSTYTSHQGTLNAIYNHPRGHWQESLSLGIEFEHSDFKDGKPFSTLLLTPAGHWVGRKLQQDGHIVTHGHRLDLGLSGGMNLYERSGYLKSDLWGKYIFSLPWSARLLHRWQIGAIYAPNFEHVPASVRFYAGGNDSLRGYRYRSLGPKDEQDKTVGGRFLGLLSLEYEQRVYKQWGVAVFFDAGNAFDRLTDIETLSRFGTGIGIRWFSPVGVVRLDFATPVIRDTPQLRFHFSVGPEL